MLHPLIILGAGASFECVDPNKLDTNKLSNRPPLTFDLFRPSFRDMIERYPEISSLASDWDAKVRSFERNFEDYLTKLLEEQVMERKNQEAHIQLAVLKLYLRDIFRRISHEYGGQTYNNYEKLIIRIRDHCDEGACIVNFNYDSLLEEKLDIRKHAEGKNHGLDAYIRNPIKVIKIHGSYDWKYLTQYSRSFSSNGSEKCYELAVRNPQLLLRGRNISDNILISDNNTEDGIPLLPAIALPMTEKESFVCPGEHIDQLKSSIQRADKILIIGWSAGDPFLLSELKELIERPVQVVIVSRDLKEANIVGKRLEGVTMLMVKSYQGAGFTDFMESNDAEEFFQR